MQGSSRRRVITRTGVAAGSVWETRMRIDEVKGGIKVFNGEESRRVDDEASAANGEEVDVKANNRSLRRNQSDGVTTERRKRKSWQPPDVPAISGGAVRSPIQLRKTRSDLCNSPKISSGEKASVNSPGNAGVVGEKRVLLIGDGREEVGGVGEVALEDEEERKSFDDKEIVLPAENVDQEKRIHQIPEIPMSPVAAEKKPSMPEIHRREMDPKPIPPPPVEMMMDDEVYESTSVAQDRMQNIVDLVMWRDISKSAFVFGVGTFSLLSSSYTKDIEFSLLSAISYLGLVYLALIFLYRSILHRGAMDLDERDVVGEEDAVWVLRWLLPYINEMLIKLKSLFSGDPAMTMKGGMRHWQLAVLLFVMARCGSSITIWTLAKLVFFGIFTIPKIFSSYKAQLAKYGKFWIDRLSDGWESCTHKKAVAAGVFTLIWNVSSTVARVWAVFMLVVAVRLYQQQRDTETWSVEEEGVVVEEEETAVVEEEEKRQEDSKITGSLRYRQRPVGPMVMAAREVKLKKNDRSSERVFLTVK